VTIPKVSLLYQTRLAAATTHHFHIELQFQRENTFSHGSFNPRPVRDSNPYRPKVHKKRRTMNFFGQNSKSFCERVYISLVKKKETTRNSRGCCVVSLPCHLAKYCTRDRVLDQSSISSCDANMAITSSVIPLSLVLVGITDCPILWTSAMTFLRSS